MLQKGKIKDSEVNVDDAKRALHIYGPDTAIIKGKTTNKGSQRINRIKYVSQVYPKKYKYTEVGLQCHIGVRRQ